MWLTRRAGFSDAVWSNLSASVQLQIKHGTLSQPAGQKPTLRLMIIELAAALKLTSIIIYSFTTWASFCVLGRQGFLLTSVSEPGWGKKSKIITALGQREQQSNSTHKLIANLLIQSWGLSSFSRLSLSPPAPCSLSLSAWSGCCSASGAPVQHTKADV